MDMAMIAQAAFRLRRSFLGLALVAAIAAAVLPGSAWAQSGAACPIGAPQIKTASTYTLTNNDQCLALIFSSATAVALTLPSATRVAPGFQVMLMSTGGGINISSSGTGSGINVSAANGLSTAAVIGQGQSGVLYGDGSNYYLGLASGFVMGPPSGSSFTNLAGVFPGVLLGNSPTVMVPNGVLQITNPASVLPSVRGDILKVCGGATPPVSQPPGTAPAWLTILDYLGVPRKVPMC